MNSAEPKEPWVARWEKGATPWDMGKAHPLTASLAATLTAHGRLAPSRRLYSAGCGHGHQEVFWAQQGLMVKAVDFVPEAIASARATYGQVPGLNWCVEDALAVAPGDEEAYDFVFDRAMLCALQPSARAAYVTASARRLRVGGWFLGILFASKHAGAGEEGPPYALSFPDVFALFDSGFSLVTAETHPAYGALPSIAQEFLVIWQKRPGHA